MIRIATVGTSWITEHFARAVDETEGIALAGVYSRNPERAREFQEKLGAPIAWSEYEDVLASANVDALYIASPNGAHYEQARLAIQAGKHVVVEKPATVTGSEFRALIEKASQRGVVIMEAMRSVYDPGMQHLRALLPKLGQIRLISLGYCQRSSRYDQVLAGEPVNIFDPQLGGGALLDLGIYCTAMLVDLFGRPQTVTGSSVLLPTGADGAGTAVAGYHDKVAQLMYSKITASAEPNVIQGEFGTLSFSSVAAPRDFQIRYLDGTVESSTVDLPEENMKYQVAHFVGLVRGDSCEPDWERTLASLDIVDRLHPGEGQPV